MIKWCSISWSDTAKILNTDVSEGLTDSKVDLSRKLYGNNVIDIPKGRNLFFATLKRFFNLNVFIILVTAFLFWFNNNINLSLLLLDIVILKFLIVNTDCYKDRKNSRILKRLNAVETKALRNGKIVNMPCRELVMGDIVLVEEGMVVPADLRLFESKNIKVKESSVTGKNFIVEKYETKIDEKELSLYEMKNILFKGSIITEGNGMGIVISTGMHTAIASTIKMTFHDENNDDGYYKRLNGISNIIGIVTVLSALAVTAVNYFMHYSINNILMYVSIILLAVLPEETSAVIFQIIFSISGFINKKRYKIRNISAIGKISDTTVLCMDKSGSYTEDMMNLRKLYTCDSTINFNEIQNMGQNIKDRGNCLKRLISVGLSCSDNINNLREAAIIRSFSDYDNIINYSGSRIFLIPEDGEKRIKTSLNKVEDGYRANIMGALDVLLDKCTHIMKNNIEKEITAEDINIIKMEDKKMSDTCLSVIGFAYRNFNYEPSTKENIESHLVFVGIGGFESPLKEGTDKYVNECRKMCIKPLMITDDNKLTAFAVGLKLSLIKKREQILSGIEIDNMSDEEKARSIKKTRIFSRITSSHRKCIAEIIKSNGDVLAMKADRLIESPSIKISDVGIARVDCMSQTVKDLSGILLQDVSFKNMIEMIKKCRKIVKNTKNVLNYEYIYSISQIIFLISLFLSKKSVIIQPLHIIAVNTAGVSVFFILLMLMYKKEDYIIKPAIIDKTFLSGRKRFIVSASFIITAGVYICYFNINMIGRAFVYSYFMILIVSFIVILVGKIHNNIFTHKIQ